MCVVLAWAAASPLKAEVKLHQIFTDNAVLQCGKKVSIWGVSDRSDAVTVKFAGQTVSATPREGKWTAELAPMKANATPGELVVTQGDQTLMRKNVVVGE